MSAFPPAAAAAAVVAFAATNVDDFVVLIVFFARVIASVAQHDKQKLRPAGATPHALPHTDTPIEPPTHSETHTDTHTGAEEGTPQIAVDEHEGSHTSSLATPPDAVGTPLRHWQVVAGQFLGFSVLVAISLVGLGIGVAVPARYIGLIGFLPLFMGVYGCVMLGWEMYKAHRKRADGRGTRPQRAKTERHAAGTEAVTVGGAADEAVDADCAPGGESRASAHVGSNSGMEVAPDTREASSCFCAPPVEVQNAATEPMTAASVGGMHVTDADLLRDANAPSPAVDTEQVAVDVVASSDAHDGVDVAAASQRVETVAIFPSGAPSAVPETEPASSDMKKPRATTGCATSADNISSAADNGNDDDNDDDDDGGDDDDDDDPSGNWLVCLLRRVFSCCSPAVLSRCRRSRAGLLVPSPFTLEMATMTIANGADNISIYIPLFAATPPVGVAATIAIFYLLVAAWCAISYALIRCKFVAKIMSKYGKKIVPFLLIGLGIYILHGSVIFPANGDD